MSHDQGSSQKCNTAAVQVVSPDDFKRALNAEDVEEVRRCLEIDSSLVNKPIVDRHRINNGPPLLYVVRKQKLSDSGRNTLALVELVQLLLDHKADVNARGPETFDGWTALHYAVNYNLVEIVELLLQYGAQVDVRTYFNGSTPLGVFYAKNLEVVRLLLAHGADVNSKDKNGYTLLFKAKNTELARLLIEHGADVNIKDNLGRIPLFVKDNVELALLLIAHGAYVNSRDQDGHPIWLAVMQDPWDLETFKGLVERGLDLEGENGFLALLLAAEYGTCEIMEFLLDQGVQVNAKVITADGETPLHFAVRRGCVGGVQLLLQRGADVNATNCQGKTPFAYIVSFRDASGAKVEAIAELLVEHVVAQGGKTVAALCDFPLKLCRRMVEKIVKHPRVDLNARVSADDGYDTTLAFDMIDKLCKNVNVYRPTFVLLIQYGADVNAKHQESGRTLLHFAAAGFNSKKSRYNGVEFHAEVQLLLERGSEVNAIDKNGFTPLLLALYHGHWNVVRILVDHGADVNIAHEDHGTPLSMACERNEESTVQLLLDAGAQVDARSKDGATVLLMCVRQGLVGRAALLLNRGADTHAADPRGSTPFLEACRRRSLDMIYCLIRSSSHHRRLDLQSEVSYPASE